MNQDEQLDIHHREWIKSKEPESLYEQDDVMVETIAAIEKKGDEWFCFRCHNQNRSRFAKLYKQDVVYCRDCLTFGRVTTESQIIRSQKKNHHVSKDAQTLNMNKTLSALQEKASNAAIKAFDQRVNHYTWAVCGAGKTEMMFLVIEKALQEGHRICWAIPRTDVVIELKPRLQEAFKRANVVALYGTSKEKQIYGDIVLSTTHQLIHFYEAFELIIVDEVDAFPYTHDVMLPRLVQKAKTKTGVIFYLSATPSEEEKKKIKRNELSSFIVPSRYHQQPLDIPQFKGCYNYEEQLKNNRVPTQLKNFLAHQLKHNRKTLLFIPTIKIGEKLSQLLTIELVHSQDEKREEKVKAYKSGTDLFLLTTMILERGITIVDVDVAVIGAESEIFSESALVQISGRVGRHPKYSSGSITFFHDGISKSMIAAREHIKMMNEKGSEQYQLSVLSK